MAVAVEGAAQGSVEKGLADLALAEAQVIEVLNRFAVTVDVFAHQETDESAQAVAVSRWNARRSEFNGERPGGFTLPAQAKHAEIGDLAKADDGGDDQGVWLASVVEPGDFDPPEAGINGYFDVTLVGGHGFIPRQVKLHADRSLE
jgi:hypothetical protein